MGVSRSQNCFKPRHNHNCSITNILANYSFGPTLCLYFACEFHKQFKSCPPENIMYLLFVRETDRVFCALRTENLDIVYVRVKAVPWFRRLVVGLSMWRSGFIPRPYCVSFVVDKMLQKTGLPPVLLFSPISVIPPILHTHLHLHVALIRRTQ